MKHKAIFKRPLSALLLTLAAASCDRAPPPAPHDTWFEAHEGRVGPLRHPDWIRSRYLHGVRLGMTSREAMKTLSDHAEVSVLSISDYDGREPWRAKYAVSGFHDERLKHDDLAVYFLAREGDPTFPASMRVYTTLIGGEEFITGLNYRSMGSFDGSNPLGEPTEAFPYYINGDRQSSYVYTSQPGWADQHTLTVMDSCSHRQVSSHFADPPQCEAERLPQTSFVHVIASSNGVVQINLRDVEAGMDHIRHNSERHQRHLRLRLPATEGKGE